MQLGHFGQGWDQQGARLTGSAPHYGDDDESILKTLEGARLRGLGERLNRDWNVQPEELSEEDETFDPDGRPR